MKKEQITLLESKGYTWNEEQRRATNEDGRGIVPSNEECTLFNTGAEVDGKFAAEAGNEPMSLEAAIEHNEKVAA